MGVVSDVSVFVHGEGPSISNENPATVVWMCCGRCWCGIMGVILLHCPRLMDAFQVCTGKSSGGLVSLSYLIVLSLLGSQ